MPKQRKKLADPPTRPEPQPVNVSKMPMVPCAECGKKLMHQRVTGDASRVLTEHYQAEHP